MVTDTAIAEEAGIEIPAELGQLTLTWNLAQDLYWDDGTQVTSADVLENYRVQKDPETLLVSRQLIDRTLSMEAPDDFTVVQTMAPGYLDFSYFADPWMGFLPAHLYEGKSVSEIRDAESARPIVVRAVHVPGIRARRAGDVRVQPVLPAASPRSAR